MRFIVIFILFSIFLLTLKLTGLATMSYLVVFSPIILMCFLVFCVILGMILSMMIFLNHKQTIGS